MSSSMQKALDLEGYVLVPSDLSSTHVSDLRQACEKTRDLAEAGKWPYLRTLPKQFPPWTSDLSNGIWGIQHLMHPDLPSHDLFASTYFSDATINVVKELLSCSEEDLVMELYNLLITPTYDFALRWHRDQIPPSATLNEEVALLSEPAWHAQWNLALYDDASLIAVPRSHDRARTDEERAADPYEKDMPNQKVLHLKAGDMVFYNNNILHRGVYDSTVQRMTLHGSIGHVAGGPSRARNILQHGVGSWVENCNFGKLEGKGIKERAEGMRARLLELGRGATNVEFLHEG